jgi:hypothetical protein
MAGEVSALMHGLLMGAQVLPARRGKVAVRAPEPRQLVLARHVALERALPRGGEGALVAAVHLTLVHSQLVVLQVVLARGPEGRVGNKKPTQKNPPKMCFWGFYKLSFIYKKIVRYRVCTPLRIFQKEIKSTLNQELMHILRERV